MRKTTVIVLSALITSPALAAKRFFYAGPSADPVTGSDPFSAYNNACKATYGPDSRIATSPDIIAANPEPEANERLWVRPKIKQVIQTGVSPQPAMLDPSGLHYQDITGCLFKDNGYGLVFNAGVQKFHDVPCTDLALRVACAAPVE